MNLPNKLSLFRILLVPVAALLYLFPYAHFHIAMPEFQIGFVDLSLVNLLVLALFAVASFTDFLDGYLARKHDLITSLGKFLDPIADKLLVNTMFILFAAKGVVPIVPVIIMVARDTVVDGLRMNAAAQKRVVAAGYLGKVKTVLQMVTIVFVLLNNLPFELMRLPVTSFLLWLATIVSVLSGYSYFTQLKDLILASK